MRKIIAALFGILWSGVRKILGRRGEGLLKDLLEAVEDEEKAFVTYHSRPMNSLSVGSQSDEIKNQRRLAIVIQGPLISQNDFTLETIKIYQKHFSSAFIILSTWSDEEAAALRRFKELEVAIILNEKPAYAGVSHINFQIVSTSSGLKKAHELGAEYVLKTRTDQRMYAPNIADYLYNITEIFPVSHGYERQRKRIVGVSLNTFKYRMYGLSDMLIYGQLDDMLLYWEVALDERRFSDAQTQKAASTSLRSFACWRVCEVYLATEFLEKVGRTLEWTLKDSWQAFADHFCVVDREQLDLFWIKYNRLEYRWLGYTEIANSQEMTFREWLNIYSNLGNKQIPEKMIDEPRVAARHICPVCGGADSRHLFRDRNRRDNIDCSGAYVQCAECSLVYLQERPSWEEIIGFYSSADKDHTGNAGRSKAKELRRQAAVPVSGWKRLWRKVRFRPHSWPLERVPKGAKKLLDLGCGNGSKLFEFAERDYEVWGVDVGKDAVRLCQELLPQGHFMHGELQETGLPDKHFDYIRLDNVLEHVPNLKEVIKECRRLLKSGGQLMVYVPHGKSLSLRLLKGDSISSWIPFHLQLFTRTSLRRLLREAGFKDIRIYGYNPIPWLSLSFMQRRNRGRAVAEYSHSRWLTWVCYPIGWLAAKFGMGEELVGVASKL
ncbi:MAG: methyltransferase domain-containing protein [Elusimicrobia bacterium]|nr:methyltransferase domain-containing protein [Elusimicrobiota bacterium]